MNPFHKYTGLILNGDFIGKDALIRGSFKASALSDNHKFALSFAAELFNESDTIAVHTSGSTGIPKQISFLKKAVIVSASATNSFFNLNANSKAVLPLPMQYIAGKLMVARALVGGYNLVVLEPNSNPNISHLTADFMPVTPFQMHRLIDNQARSLKNIGTYLIGGGEPDKTLITKIVNSGITAFASFGMTETLSHFALARLDQTAISPIYEPVKGAQVKTNAEGNLLVNWPAITHGWLDTNDLAEISSNGFHWLGRADNLINSGGVKIIPERVEQILRAEIDCPFFVAGIPHNNLGQELVLFAEAATEINFDSVEWDFKHQKPKRIVVLNSFLRTISGKVKRKASVDSWLKSL